MCQIMQEQDEKKEKKDKVKARQKRLVDVQTQCSMKPKKKRSNALKNIISGFISIAGNSLDDEEI